MDRPAPLEVPSLRSAFGNWRGVAIETAELAGSMLAAVTTRCQITTRRRWFGSEADALAYAVEQADAHNLPLLDLRDADHG